MNAKCASCDKTVYPVEKLNCLDKVWHKGCFKCQVCSMTLNMKTYKGYNKFPYCNAHYPQNAPSFTPQNEPSFTPEVAQGPPKMGDEPKVDDTSPSGGYVAIYDYTAADDDEVSFQEGDVIRNVEIIDEGWMTGTVERTGEHGMLPSNYVEKQ